MTPESVISALQSDSPGALLLEPRSLFDSCLVGVSMSECLDDQWQREPGHLVAVYGVDECLGALAADIGSWEEASEWFWFNTAGAWAGQFTPGFRHDGLEE